MHPGDRSAYHGERRRAGGVVACERRGLPVSQIFRRRLSDVHGVERFTRNWRASGLVAQGRSGGQENRDRRFPAEHIKSETLDLLSGVPAAVRPGVDRPTDRRHARARRDFHDYDVRGLCRLRGVCVSRPFLCHLEAAGDGLAAADIRGRLRRSQP